MMELPEHYELKVSEETWYDETNFWVAVVVDSLSGEKVSKGYGNNRFNASVDAIERFWKGRD